MSDIDYFAKPKNTWSYGELEAAGEPPRSSGVYAWYFYRIPPMVPKDELIWISRYRMPVPRDSYALLYIGKAMNLRERIMRWHFGGDLMAGDMSSLRLTLGCLLSESLKTCLYYLPTENADGSARYVFGAKADSRLTEWMKNNARVAWIVTDKPGMVEDRAVRRYKPKLNTADNAGPFSEFLKGVKKCFRRYALPEDSDLYGDMEHYPLGLAIEAARRAIREGEK